jgi:hypothetical protein
MSTVQVPQGVCMYGGGGMLHTCPKSLGSRTRPFKVESSYTNLPYCYFLKGIVSTLYLQFS